MKNKEKVVDGKVYDNETETWNEPDQVDENFDGREEHFDKEEDLQVEAYNENNPSQHDLDVQSREEAAAAADKGEFKHYTHG